MFLSSIFYVKSVPECNKTFSFWLVVVLLWYSEVLSSSPPNKHPLTSHDICYPTRQNILITTGFDNLNIQLLYCRRGASGSFSYTHWRNRYPTQHSWGLTVRRQLSSTFAFFSIFINSLLHRDFKIRIVTRYSLIVTGNYNYTYYSNIILMSYII